MPSGAENVVLVIRRRSSDPAAPIGFARRREVESAGQQRGKRRFASARAAFEQHPVAALDFQRTVLEDWLQLARMLVGNVPHLEFEAIFAR